MAKKIIEFTDLYSTPNETHTEALVGYPKESLSKREGKIWQVFSIPVGFYNQLIEKLASTDALVHMDLNDASLALRLKDGKALGFCKQTMERVEIICEETPDNPEYIEYEDLFLDKETLMDAMGGDWQG